MSEFKFVIFGDYVEPAEGDIIGRLSLSFQSGTLNIDELWEGSALSANFLSTFWGRFFPVHDHESVANREKMQDEVHYICSELLGNAVKFSYIPEFMIEICLYLHEKELRFYVTNSVNPDELEKFQSLINRILTEDTQELFLEQIEKSTLEDNDESGIGYLTIINDYQANLAWKFQNIKPEFKSVTVLARLPVTRKN